MGSGKSTLGKKLAGRLKLPFTDLDDFLQKKEGKTIQEIFNNEGETQFREYETLHLKSLCSLPSPHVFALGGGTVCFNDNLSLVKKSGTVIYLQLSAAAIANRVKQNQQSRPLLKDLNGEALLHYITQSLQQREPFYIQADFILQALDLTAQQIEQLLLENSAKNNH